MEKQRIKEILENVLQSLRSDDVKRHDWYGSLFPDDVEPEDAAYNNSHSQPRYSYENTLAIQAVRHPELHGLMQEIVLALTEFGEWGRTKRIWENETEQAGGAFARELAMFDKSYIPLYFSYIKTNDLDHEVYQLSDMMDIFEKWDYGKEVYPLLLYRAEWGQNADMYIDAQHPVCTSREAAEGYLQEAIGYFREEWDFDSLDEAEAQENEDIEQLKAFLRPVFVPALQLDEEQFTRFVLNFNNAMAEEESPTIGELI